MGYAEYQNKIKRMIDDLKAMTADLGLANTGDEYKIISELFTYKFLNDKLLYQFDNREDKSESFDEFVDFADTNTARISADYLLSKLFQRQNEKGFNKIFDLALQEISELNKDVYSIETSSGSKKALFEPLSAYLRDPDKELELAKRAINILNSTTFDGEIFEEGWDFFSSIFEYLIKDYNKDSGKYAEYYTPAFAGAIMADILYNDTPVRKVEIYDPAAGSGTLLLSMANKVGTKNCTIYSQDRSQKSTQFLRINLILNSLAQSLEYVIEGNTLTNPWHKEADALKRFDFVVSNPPFNVDFSADVKTLETDRYNRFFAGIPNIPDGDKSEMAIYLCFIQHIIASLKDDGKAAIVVPAGFLTHSQRYSKIGYSIRELLVEKKWLRGVITMPSSIFATTGTNVALMFIDKGNTSDEVMLVDASGLGEKYKDGNVQRTTLMPEEIELIKKTFKRREKVEDFSTLATFEDIKKKDYSFAPAQYFDIKIEYVDISEEEFEGIMKAHKEKLSMLFKEGKELEELIVGKIEDLFYE